MVVRSAPLPAPVGRVFGGYRVEVGEPRRGGTAVLYEAAHADTGTPALVKLLLPDALASDSVRRRFRDEGEQLLRIDHPGVVKVLAAGEDENEPFLVLEKLEGQNLRERLRTWGAPDVERVLAIVRELVDALTAVHVAGVIHRDLKPENIFLVHDPNAPGHERVCILDFGVAKPSTRTDSFATRQGSHVGTEPYMAPEQWRDPSLADARTDLYAVGCLLYELLSGEPPFGFIGNLGEAHARQSVPPLPGFVPRPVRLLTERLLEKDAARRFASGDELLRALDRLDTDGSSAIRVARPKTAVDLPLALPPTPWTRDRRVWTALVVGAAGGALVTWLVTSAL